MLENGMFMCLAWTIFSCVILLTLVSKCVVRFPTACIMYNIENMDFQIKDGVKM